MAVMEAQRYPDDYDGIIAGALANATSNVDLRVEQQVRRHASDQKITAAHATIVNNWSRTPGHVEEGLE